MQSLSETIDISSDSSYISFINSLDTCEKLFLASDHAGYPLKETLKDYLLQMNQACEDLGPFNKERCDHPDFAIKLCKKVLENPNFKGILICGSGVGIAIVANKFKGIRCGVCYDYLSAISAKTKDYCNVIAMGGRIIGPEVARIILEVFLKRKVERGEVYYERMKKIENIEKMQ